MQDRFDNIVKGLFPEGATVLLAVSGGRDSMCMANLFLHSAISFAVANCNFHLRGAESDGDSELVESWCRSRGIAFYRADFDTEAYASARQLSIEMAARELRYEWFAQLCREKGFAALAVAHNANDNAETMVLNMLRGSGIRGMAGMRLMSMVPVPGAGVPLCRPLLSFTRDEIDAYVSAESVPFRDDSTNAGTEYRRNKLRHEVFPVFGQINPSFVEALNRDMANLRQVSDVADEWYAAVRSSVVAGESPDELRIDLLRLRNERNAQYLLFRLLEPYGFSPSDINQVLAAAPGRFFLSEEWRLVTSAKELIVTRRPDGTASGKDSGSDGSDLDKGFKSDGVVSEGKDCVVVEAPGLYELGGVRFSVEVADRSPEMPLKQPEGITAADAGSMVLPFIVRKWKNGDWMVPLGLHGRKKLSDMFVDLKMSIPDKGKALVAVVPGMNPSGPDGAGKPARVAALLGKRIDESVRITEGSSKVVIVRILS